LIQAFRTYKGLILAVLPFFFLGTAVQHTFDLENWFSIEESANAGNSFMEILEEHSLEDDIETMLVTGLMRRPLITNPTLRVSAFNDFERTVPTPPPDLV
jgi:hypothetical protein